MMNLGELLDKLGEIPADFPRSATVYLSDDRGGFDDVLTEVSWDDDLSKQSPPVTDPCVWLYASGDDDTDDVSSTAAKDPS